MPKIHELVEGECVESVALLYGFHPTTIWEHPENADLREVRISPHVLVPGEGGTCQATAPPGA
jgi:N-acetylmuramoyl-L-alanine amidase